MLISIEGAEVQQDRLIIKDRSVAYRIALNILTNLALTEGKEVEDDRPIWPGKR